MLLLSPAFLTLGYSVLSALASGVADQVIFHDEEKGSHYAPVLDDEFATWLEETGKVRGMKGVAIAVTRKNKDGDGWTTETKGFGVADRWGTPVDEKTLFSIGSNSKLFTALGVGLLTANESIPIDWHTKIKDILPKSLWVLQDPVAQEYANIVDILSHRTGLPRHDIAKLRYLRPSAEFRETAQYNNQMYTVGAHIISHVTGTPFQTYITRNIITPLGLNSTTYNVSHAEQFGTLADEFVATGVRGERIFKPIPYWNKRGGEDFMAGPGGVISNVKDLATWLQALLLLGRSPETNDTIIPPSIVEKVTDGVMVFAPRGPEPEISPEVYGMGQARYSYQGHEFIEHNGGTIGHFSVVTRSAENNLGIAVLINTMSAPGFLEMIKWRVIEKSLGLKHVNWGIRYPTSEESARQGNSTESSPPPADRSPSTLPHHELAGVYFNPAYGTLTLCPFPLPNPFGPSRKDCDGIVPDGLKSHINATTPVLIAAWPKVWSSHVLLYHDSGDKYNALTALAFPPPFPDVPTTDADSRPFAIISGTASVEFVFATREGNIKYLQGMAGRDAWGAGLGVEAPKGDGREGAEIWFDRVI